MTTQIVVRIIVFLLQRYLKNLSKEQRAQITEAAKGNFERGGSMGGGENP